MIRSDARWLILCALVMAGGRALQVIRSEG